MINLKIYSIAKKERSIYDELCKDFYKLSSRDAKIEDIEIFTKDVTKAHTKGETSAKRVYSDIYKPYLSKGYSIALHPDGKKIDSYEFSKLLSDKMSVQFFIGGAFGFEDTFLDSFDRVISLSSLTMSHKIVKVVLAEQIYRGFSILSNHPYHK